MHYSHEKDVHLISEAKPVPNQDIHCSDHAELSFCLNRKWSNILQSLDGNVHTCENKVSHAVAIPLAIEIPVTLIS